MILHIEGNMCRPADTEEPGVDGGAAGAGWEARPGVRQQFWCWCEEGDTLAAAKLRVRCQQCRQDAVLLQRDPASWEDISSGLPGDCQHCKVSQDRQTRSGKTDTFQVTTACQFYFRCGSAHPAGHEVTALQRVRGNLAGSACLACTDTLDTVLVLPGCGHTSCLPCWAEYCRVRLAERQFQASVTWSHGTLPEKIAL